MHFKLFILNRIISIKNSKPQHSKLKKNFFFSNYFMFFSSCTDIRKHQSVGSIAFFVTTVSVLFLPSRGLIINNRHRDRQESELKLNCHRQ